MAKERAAESATGLGNRVLLDKIDKLRSLGVTGIPLPQIVVVGDQSAGKSSVLESLTGFHFPRNVTLCTRHVTEIVCRRDEVERIMVSVLPHDPTPERKKLAKAFGREITNLEVNGKEFSKIFQEAAEVMGIQSGNSGGQGSAFSKDVLRIEISGPKTEHLTVIDVPGMFENDTPGVTTKADIALVKGMVAEKIQESRTIILAVVPCNGDIANQKILTLATEVDPKGERTLGVLTKPDLAVENATKQLVVDLVNGQRKDLVLGYCVVKNRSADDAGSTALERDLEEERFFSQAPWNGLDGDRLGIKALRKRLQRLLMDRTKSEFPNVIAEIMSKRKHGLALLKDIGESRATADEQRIYLGKIAARFMQLRNNALDAHYRRDAAFAERSELKLITRIRELNEAFANTMISSGHGMAFSEDCEEKTNGQWAEDGSLKDSLANNRKQELDSRNSLYDCELSFDIPVEREWEVEDILQGVPERTMPQEGGILEYIENEHLSSRGYEIGTFNSELVRHIFKELAKKWDELTLAHISNVILVVHHFFNDILEVACPNQGTLENLQSFLRDELIEGYVAALRRGQFLLEVELQGVSVTYHPGFQASVKQAREARVGQVASAGADEQQDEEKALATTNENDDETAARIHDWVRAYYEICRNRFVDVVCQQAVDHCLLHAPKSPLASLSSEVVLGMSSDQLESIAGEELATREKRDKLMREVERLRQALKILKG